MTRRTADHAFDLTVAPLQEVIYRCYRCGIESKEATCFVKTRNKASPLARTCVTCGQRSPATGHFRNILATFWVLFLPLLCLVGFKDKTNLIFSRLLLATCLLQPLTLVLHEAGHCLTARLLGLEVGLVSFGVGPSVWVGNILGTRVHIHGWPLSGLTYLGSRSMRFLRLRVWLTVLMGPGANGLLLVGTAFFWESVTRIFDTNVVILWMIFNAMYVVINLIPFRSGRSGVLHRSDGFQLLHIPFRKSADLAVYLSTTALISAMQLFNDLNYEAAREACLRGLERKPADPMLLIMVSACHINLGDYKSGQAVLGPLIDLSVTLEPSLRAVVENNFALALWLVDFKTPQRSASLCRAIGLLDQAHKAYPCVLAYRTSYALLLTDTDRSEEALALLNYMNYETGNEESRSNQQIARSFALRRLNRNEEAEDALAAGLKLCKKRLPWLTTIGLITAKTLEPLIHS